MSKTFLRNLISQVVSRRQGVNRDDYARSRWGTIPLLKAAVPAGNLIGNSIGSDPGTTEFFGEMTESTVVARIRPRAVPANAKVLLPDSSSVGYWVGAARAVPLSYRSVTGSVLERRKVAALVAMSAEVFDAQSERAEAALEADLRRALVATMDSAFIDPANAGVADEMPASITNGVTPIASTGDPTQDLRALIAAFAGDLAVASFVTDPHTAAAIALWRDSGGGVAFPDAGPSGGSLLGLPMVTSRAVPRDSSPASGMIALVDGSGIAVSLEGMEITMSKATSLEMTDAPTAEGFTPSPQSVTTVSLFQTDIVALMVTMFANWETQRTGAVSVVTGANYG